MGLIKFDIQRAWWIILALGSTQPFLCQFSLSPKFLVFSVFYLHDLVENKGQDVLPMGSGQEAWRELSTRPFVFGGQEESHMAVCPGPGSGYCKRGKRGIPWAFLCQLSFWNWTHISPQACVDGLSRTWPLDAISEYFCVSARPRATIADGQKLN